MTNQEDEDNGLVVRIPASLLVRPDAPIKQTPRITGDYHFFARTGIVPIQVERNSEHGKTEVQSLGFADYIQRLNVIELLDTPALYNKLPELFDYIYQLGCERDGEKRYYAAVAVGELAAKRPFHDLKDAIILPWAKSDTYWIRNSASVALSQVLKHERHKTDVLMLLRHWIGSYNPMLTDAALSAFRWAARSHPNDALEAVSIIVKAGRALHYASAIELFGIVYETDPVLAIEQLHAWLLPIAKSDICWMAGMLLLIHLRLDDATSCDATRKKVVEMIFNLWDNPVMLLHQAVQEQTTMKVEKWAREVLSVWDKESPKVVESYSALFHELFGKYTGQMRNRLKYHLLRWEKSRAREQVRASRAKGGSSLGVSKAVSYCDLMPQGSDD